MRTWYLVLGVGLVAIVGFLLFANLSQAPAPAGDILLSMASSTLSLTSPAFPDGGTIPAKFTCDDRRELSPALSIAGVPEGAKSLALIMDDPDIPAQVKRPDMQEFDHWVLFDLPPGTREIPEGGIKAGTTGLNSAGNSAYTGPCPPPQYEPSEHRYVFMVYALDTTLGLSASTTKAQLLRAMEGHVIAQAQLIGRYKRLAQ